MSKQNQNGRAGWIGLVLVRFIVPLWIGIGATVKLAERSPKLLPEHLRDALDVSGIDLHWALAWFIGIEIAAVLIMVLLPRLAREVAIFMLSVFCLVLLYEIFNGNVTNCGCLGSYSPAPWLMLSIDLAMLIAVIALPVRHLSYMPDRLAAMLTSFAAIFFFILAYIHVVGSAKDIQVVVPQIDGSQPSTSVDSTTTITLPPYYTLDVSDWSGKPIREIELISWIPDLPPSIEEGQQYLIMYSRTCEHCHELLLEHFSYDPPAPTTLVAIPESTDGFAEGGGLDNPCLDCLEVELPVGTDWLMTPPIVISIEDGVVQCAQESEETYDPQCLPWHGF
ncbi:MAG: hypothetical protein MK100_02590 [Phycisphaerales bacterium]|nr:hypothetical protein [Phycisphaerales bacterium]